MHVLQPPPTFELGNAVSVAVLQRLEVVAVASGTAVEVEGHAVAASVVEPISLLRPALRQVRQIA